MARQEFLNAVSLCYPAVMAAMLLATPAMADDSKNPAITPRQMAHCVMQRMHEDRTQSYKEAFKSCRQDFAAVEAERVASNNTGSEVETAK
jgi:hypothetical protein